MKRVGPWTRSSVRLQRARSLDMSQGKMGNAADSGDPPEGGTWHEWGGEWDPGPFGIMANLAGAVTGRQTGRMNESDRLRKLLENLRFLQVRFDKLDGRQRRSAARKLRRTGSGHASRHKNS
ncbi:hypothetical protein ASPTUDRAFT_607454 [Aspergillus tubingensis CBS 134.48]|uniref:Uncharacterized protein n=1 Tax=Aspergillus tubingensis (strain CBS 134.48) TaxID=767770 RepID=A0A1L9N356_ASPTC|nr:hypothetical protein ASPTUDRAFT_607454 [Aspergillus tubingensis CBS 134.48]